MSSKTWVVISAVGLFLLVLVCGKAPTGSNEQSSSSGQSNAPVPYVEYKPPLLPIKFVFQSGGISVLADKTIVTPLGSFAIGASLPVIDNSQILVVLRDTKKGKDTLYRINAGRKLRIVVDGRTAIEVNSDGVVLIDVTEGKIQSIEIMDKNQEPNKVAASSDENAPSSSALTNPHLSGSPKDWIPGSDEIPNILQRMDDIERSNEYTAKTTANPTKTLELYKEWGRVTGYMQWYYTKEGCGVKTGLVSIAMAPSLYVADAGAKQSVEFNKSADKTDVERIDKTSTVGEEAYIGYSSREITECEPSFEERAVAIMFRRYNATGYVVVSGVSGTVTDDYMLSIATRLAQLMDAKFAAAVQ